MRGVKKGWIFVFVLILFSFTSVVSAASNDFIAIAGTDFRACSCSLIEDSIKIINTGDFTNTFFVKQSGPAAEFSTFFPDKFVLAPGDEITIYEYIRLPCNAQGSYFLLTDIKTNLNLHKQFLQEIEAVKCANIQINPIITSVQACRCTPLNYQVEVKNPSTFSEKYSFSLDRFENFYVMNPNSTKLISGQSRDISFNLWLPCNYQSQNFNFVVKAEKSGFEAKLPVAAIINSSCYNLKFNETINATLYQPPSKKLIGFSLAAFFSVLLLIILAAVFLLVKKKPEKQPEKRLKKKPEKEPYWWEELFMKKELERPIYKELLFRKRHKILKIIIIAIIIIIVIVMLSVTANYLLPPLENFTFLNVTNKTPGLPFLPVTTATFEPVIVGANETLNETLTGDIGFAVPYASYIIAGVLLLLTIVFIMRFTRKEGIPYYEKISEEGFRKKFFIIAAILAIIAFIVLAVSFYIKGIIAVPFPEFQLPEFQLPEIFSKESISMVKSYIPYIIIGVILLVATIFVLRVIEKRVMEKKGK